MRRREFLRVGGAALLAASAPRGATALLRALAAGGGRVPGSTPFPSAAGQPRPDLAPELANIDHIIVVMMENHSFDNYLGMLPHRVAALRGRVDGFPVLGSDGIPAVAQTDPKGATYRAFPMPSGCQAIDPGPSQSWTSSHRAYNGGAMDGFLAESGEIALGYWDEGTLPFLYSLASTFPVCDRWFSSTLCQTYPNRVFLMAGTAAGLISTDTPPPTVTPANGHIFDVLDHYGVSWGCYFSDLPTPGLFGAAWAAQRVGTNLVGPFGSVDATIQHFKARAMLQQLPQVLFVESEYQYASEENPQDIRAGQYFVSQVVAALMASPSWARSLLVFTYDEHGGYYDHVPPPAALGPGDGSHPQVGAGGSTFGDDYTRLGIRVPAVIVSPWARAQHTSHTVYDHTSVLATIQRKWNLPALTFRDANANHLGDTLVSGGAAPFATPPPVTAQPLSTQVQSLACEEVPGAAGTLPGPLGPAGVTGGRGPGGIPLPGTVAAGSGGPNTGGAGTGAWPATAAATAIGLAAVRARRRYHRSASDAEVEGRTGR